MLQNKLVRTVTEDKLILSGLYIESERRETAAIFIHGFPSDFFSHQFPVDIAVKLKEIGVSTILAQTRGTGAHTEVIKEDRKDGVYIGGFYEKLEEAHLDITAWIKFLKGEGHKKIVLIGHSLGTIKVIRYLTEGEHSDDIEKIVLLGVFDKNWFVVEKAGSNREAHLALAMERIEQGRGQESVSSDMEDFAVSFNTYYSWYNTEQLSCMFDFHREDYDFPTLRSIKIPTLVVMGDKDHEFMKDFSKASELIKKNIPNCEYKEIADTGHTFLNKEEELSNIVSNFLK